MSTLKNPLPARPVNYSAVEEQVHIVFPGELNGNNEAFGGLIFSLMDKLAGAIFRLHSGMGGATASFDEGEFICPVKQNDMLVFRGAINRVWRSSCEIGVKVFLVRHSGGEKEYAPVTRCYFTYVSMEFDEGGARKKISPVIPKTEEQKERFAAAGQRRKRRLLRKRIRAQKVS